MCLLADERKKIIMDILDVEGKVTVRSLAERFGVTTETIRRDLEDLEKLAKLKKVFGGAIKISFDGVEPPYNNRMNLYKSEKKAIGMAAASFVNDNDVIAIDVGTTTLQVIPNLIGKHNLTILVNSVPALTLLIDFINKNLIEGKVIFLGGEINTHQMSSYGPISNKLLKDFYIDKAFIATDGLSIKYGITSFDINEGTFSRMIIDNSKEAIVVADHSKIGVRNFYKIADIDLINIIISDKEPPTEWVDELKNKDINWVTAKN